MISYARGKARLVGKIVRKALLDFAADRCFRSSAALSYYTLFSVAPVVLITLSVAGFFMDENLIREEITERFRTLIGEDGAQGVFVLLRTVNRMESGLWSLLFGIGLLVFTATTIFVQMQWGLNEVFGVEPAEGRKGWFKLIKDRLISLGLILSLGFAMIISLVLDTLIATFVRGLTAHFEDISVFLVQGSQNLVVFGLVLIVIYALFRWLPDVEIPRQYLRRGAVLTTVLLLVGKFAIGWYIGRSNLSELGGAASSIVVLMLWVYFSSMILFFGAELIKAQAYYGRQDYHAGRFARRMKRVEVEVDED